MRKSNLFSPVMRLAAVSLLTAAAFAAAPGLSAGKPPASVCGSVYLSSGDSIVAEGSERIGPPVNKKKLDIIEDAYTKQSRIGSRLLPEEVDSAVLWVATAPGRPHTFRFVEGYGWCWRLENNPRIAVYCFSPKGYHFAGNGGLWVRGKGVILVVKDGKAYDFGRADKRIDTRQLGRAIELVSDDPALSERLGWADGRRDKVLRLLALYDPD